MSKKPSTLLLIIAILVLLIFMPSGWLSFLGATAWYIIKALLVIFAIIIILSYFVKKK